MDEKEATKFLIGKIREGYGADCKTSDLADFPKMYENEKIGELVMHPGRCGSCRAKETIAFLENHIELMEMGD